MKRIKQWLARRQQKHNLKQQELAYVDTMIYGCSFLRIDAKGRMTRIPPTELYSKLNTMTSTYENPLVDELKEKGKWLN
jgi:hypothetical protein